MTRKRSETFDDAAQLYDRARPGYPNALIDAVVAHAGLTPDARILEIGSGTGKGTLPFAARGYAIHCVEPGRNLAAIAAANLRQYPNIQIEIATFEDWIVQECAFDLVISAQAFHWIAPEVKYVKTATALKDGGHLALFWNMDPDPAGGIFDEFDQAYRTHAPMIARTAGRKTHTEHIQDHLDEIRRSDYFDHIVVERFPWTAHYTAARYLDLLNTHSDHRLLPEANRHALLGEVAEIIAGHGGAFLKPYVAVLYMAQKR